MVETDSIYCKGRKVSKKLVKTICCALSGKEKYRTCSGEIRDLPYFNEKSVQ
jgi:hypothetical protein